ncbi:hypothetical protein VTL71DRAFT_1612 [Oculimacula yallundae]|uniref:Uncharacterized protein n=1 Tax=Oculimacula yallundae TaxID=86028 RepID=A0ABR4CB83_9HELO
MKRAHIGYFPYAKTAGRLSYKTKPRPNHQNPGQKKLLKFSLTPDYAALYDADCCVKIEIKSRGKRRTPSLPA